MAILLYEKYVSEYYALCQIGNNFVISFRNAYCNKLLIAATFALVPFMALSLCFVNPMKIGNASKKACLLFGMP